MDDQVGPKQGDAKVSGELALNQEYMQCAMDVGDADFKIKFYSARASELMNRMFEINKELASLKSAKDKEPS